MNREIQCSLRFFLYVLILYSVSSQIIVFSAFDHMSWTIFDDNLEVYIFVEGINVKEANNRLDAILIDPNGVINAYAEITSTADDPLTLDELEIAFIWANIDAFKSTQELNSTLFPGNTLSANQTFNVEDYLGLGDLQFISGIYKFRYNLDYSIDNHPVQMNGNTFYMKIAGNPLETVTGAAATAAVAASGISLLWIANSVRKVSPLDLETSINTSFVAPTKKLLSFYRAKTYKSIQNEISNTIYSQATSWKGDICPLCSTDWPEKSPHCIECEISIDEAKKHYLLALEDTSLRSSKELVDSVSGLSLYNIAQDIGGGMIPTTSIISVLTSSGLALVEPRISHSMNKKTRRLIFSSLSTALLTVFWIQAMGIEVASLFMLLIAILTGTIPAMLIRRTLELNLKKKITNFFNQKTLVQEEDYAKGSN